MRGHGLGLCSFFYTTAMTRKTYGPRPTRMAMLSLGAVVCSLVLGAALGITSAYADDPVLAIDVDPTGNTPTSIGTVNTCVSVAKGDSFKVDVVVENITDLLSWQIYFQYDPAILQVTQRNVRLFQQANGGSSVYDLSDKVPDTDGVYSIEAADTSDPPSPDSGSGVLTELTLSAIGSGTSDVALVNQDLDGDAKPDRGTLLRNVDTQIIGDKNGDTFFDGEVDGAKVAVDQACPPGSNEGHASRGMDEVGGLKLLYVVAAVAAAVGVALAGAFIFLSRRRSRAHSH